MHTAILDALRQQDSALARTLAEQAVQAAPEDWQARRLLALALAMQDDTPAAHAQLDQAMALAPDQSILHVQRAALLLAESRLDEVAQVLQTSVALDPNTLPAYLMRARLALRQGDMETAAAQGRLAARLDPDHPELLAIQGLMALQQQQPAEALQLLDRSVRSRSDHPQTLYALALAYQANGHAAFAEQAMRRVLELLPDDLRVRLALAQLIARQGRANEAADTLAAAPEGALTADGLRLVGELRLEAGHPDAARAALEQALQQRQDDPRLVGAWVESVRRQGDAASVVETVDTWLQQYPHAVLLWTARLQLATDADDARAVADRWQLAMPDAIEALAGRFQVAIATGDNERSGQLAQALVERQPLHLPAQLRLLKDLSASDPQAAIAHIRSLQALPSQPETAAILQDWLAHACDRAGEFEAAVQAWLALHPTAEAGAVPLPAASGDSGPYPALGAPAADAPTPRPMFLFGLPGSAVERVAALLDANTPIFRGDRLRPPGVDDGLRTPDGLAALATDPQQGQALVASWQATLAQRGITDGRVIDWLAWWDNALLHALRPRLPQGMLLLVVRDPRQMLLDWLSAGAAIGYRLDDPLTAARWLATQLDQLAELMQQGLYPHIRFDPDVADIDDVQAQCEALGQAIGAQLLPAGPFRATRLPDGHWRAYCGTLDAAFAALQPVSVRLGYPAD